MREALNDLLRALISITVVWLGLFLTLLESGRLITFEWNQRRLRHRYGVSQSTPILEYGSELERLIDEAANRASGQVRFAYTSGSTAQPKRLLYTKRRLRGLKLAFVDMFARGCWSTGIRRTSLYVFGSLAKDNSLTSLLLEEPKIPGYLTTLQASYRIQCHPAVQALLSEYGPTAIALWILALANPGVLYSTNPSSLVIFLDKLRNDWDRSARLVKDWHESPEQFDPSLVKFASRVKSRGWFRRLKLIATSTTPLAFEKCAPAVSTYICWTGGYLKSFLDRLENYLPAPRYRLIPMYSMSTETAETHTHFEHGGVTFLPIAKHVFYEFVEEGREDLPENLLAASKLQPGRSYAMVVTDSYGLRRYQTGDLFLCQGHVHGLPDLHFLRRRELEYSFTGEKLTSAQVTIALERLRDEYPELHAAQHLACIPSHRNAVTPHYKMVLVTGSNESLKLSVDALGPSLDQLLSECNSEYRSKRESGRLGAIRIVQVTAAQFMSSVENPQFKFLPLYRRTWEEVQSH